MSERVTEDGEVIEDIRSPLQVARSELAGFKFKLIETVAADPKLSKAPCTEAIVVYASFVTIDKRTLKPTDAYCSTVKLMARGKMRSKTTARLARNLLQQAGYLVPTGSSTKDGCVRYRLANPRAEQIDMHVKEAEEYLAQVEVTRKEEERRKRRGVSLLYPQNEEGGSIIDRTGGQYTDPKYRGGNLSKLGSEEETLPIKVSTAPESNGYLGKEDDPHQPYPPPESEDELEAMLSALASDADFPPTVMAYFRIRYVEGRLTPAMIETQRRRLA